MRLTRFSDYSFRTLIYLGAHGERLVPLPEIAEAYGISYNHLVKVARMLAELGVVTAVRGRSGGLRLAVEPARINIGWLVRHTEPDFHLVECFDQSTNGCRIAPACVLRQALLEARESFLETLDGYTLASFLSPPQRRQELVSLWGGSADRDHPSGV